jgi:hypothetical protein
MFMRPFSLKEYRQDPLSLQNDFFHLAMNAVEDLEESPFLRTLAKVTVLQSSVARKYRQRAGRGEPPQTLVAVRLYLNSSSIGSSAV